MVRNETLREKPRIKPVAYAVVIFVTLGLTIANETLAQLGLQQNYAIQFSLALVLAALLASRNALLILCVILGVLAMNMPEPSLARYYLDRDILLAFVCAIVLFPSVYHLLGR